MKKPKPNKNKRLRERVKKFFGSEIAKKVVYPGEESPLPDVEGAFVVDIGNDNWLSEVRKMKKKKCNRAVAKNPCCPKCKSKQVIPIQYGLPTLEQVQMARKGKLKDGGCEVEMGSPDWHCKNCRHEWTAAPKR